MFLFGRPSPAQIERFLEASAHLPLSYGPEGLATESPSDFDIGELVVSLGHGQETFERAKTALRAWRHYEIGWVELFPRSAPAEPGSVVAVLIRHFGFWSLNGCRVLYSIGDGDRGARYGFAYGTLPNHAERGEEIFEVARDSQSDEVTYRIRGVSQPRAPITRVTQPIVHMFQARFRRDSGHALRAALEGRPR